MDVKNTSSISNTSNVFFASITPLYIPLSAFSTHILSFFVIQKTNLPKWLPLGKKQPFSWNPELFTLFAKTYIKEFSTIQKNKKEKNRIYHKIADKFNELQKNDSNAKYDGGRKQAR